MVFIEMYVSIALSLERWKRANPIREIWRRIAFVTRYGHISLTEALTLPVSDLRSYTDALAHIVEQENEAAKPKR